MATSATRPPVNRPRDVPPDLEGLEWLAWLMDRAFKVPGTPFRVGIDAILGLLPVGGDFLTGLVQVGIVLVALHRYKVPRAIAARMAANVLLDTTLGALPLVGDAFDAVFKANTRNVRLLEQVHEQRQQGLRVATAGSWLFLATLGLGLLGVLILVFIGFATVVVWAIHRLQGNP